MHIGFATLVFALGLIVGSFLNVVVFRLNTGESIARGRSRCFSCGNVLHTADLIPVVSFLLQRGRCRYCSSRISWQYPLVELVTGIVFLLTAVTVQQKYLVSGIWYLVFWLAVWSILIALSVYDIRHKIIPNQLVYTFIALAFAFSILGNWNLFENWKLIIENLLAGLGAFSFFALLWGISGGRWMGFGDAKLALGMGFLLGPFPTMFAGMLAFWIGALISMPIVAARGGGMKTQIPFGPFLALATFAVWLWGDRMLAWYFSLFL